jgi:hypothetical protein
MKVFITSGVLLFIDLPEMIMKGFNMATRFQLESFEIPLNVVVGSLALLLLNWEVLGSNLIRILTVLTEFFVVSSDLLCKSWDCILKLGYNRFLPHPFQFFIHLSPLIRRCVTKTSRRISENASLNTKL